MMTSYEEYWTWNLTLLWGYAIMCAKWLNPDRKEKSERNSGRTF